MSAEMPDVLPVHGVDDERSPVAITVRDVLDAAIARARSTDELTDELNARARKTLR